MEALAGRGSINAGSEGVDFKIWVCTGKMVPRNRNRGCRRDWCFWTALWCAEQQLLLNIELMKL